MLPCYNHADLSARRIDDAVHPLLGHQPTVPPGKFHGTTKLKQPSIFSALLNRDKGKKRSNFVDVGEWNGDWSQSDIASLTSKQSGEGFFNQGNTCYVNVRDYVCSSQKRNNVF